MLYLTQNRLMRESERTIREYAYGSDEAFRRVCTQVLADPALYRFWRTRHARRMKDVALGGEPRRQVAALRAISVRQIQKTALVRYLHDQRVTGFDRDRVLTEFYGVKDSRASAVREHRNYLEAACSRLCLAELLTLAGDEPGLQLLRDYDSTYRDYFRLFCDRVRAIGAHKNYLLDALIPEVRAAAEVLRRRIVDGELLIINASLVAHGPGGQHFLRTPPRSRQESRPPLGKRDVAV
jgi:hypothetical protein